MKPTNKAAFCDCQRKSAGPPTQGDRQALQNVLSRYSPVFYRTALRQLQNPEDAEDAVQEALLSAWKHISQFEGRSQISTWLTRIVINSARMELRRRSRRENISLEQTQEDQNSGLADQFVDARPNPEKVCEQAELREILNALLQHLSPLRCSAFRLHELDGFSVSEAAQILGRTETAVKYQLFRARAQLCVLLQTALGPRLGRKLGSLEEAAAESRS